MLSRSPLLLALALLACPSSKHAQTRAPGRAKGSADARAPQTNASLAQPRYLLLAPGAPLYAAPNEDAFMLRFGVAEDASSLARGVAVVGREGDYWKIETVDDAALTKLGVQAIEGLDLYALTLYVPIGEGEAIQPIPPGPDTLIEPAAQADARAEAIARMVATSGLLAMLASNPPLQSGERRPAGLDTDFRVNVGSKAYWPDGRVAGEVRREHAFVEAGEPRASEAGQLRCFVVRVGPDEGGQGELCFAADDVRVAEVVPEPESPFGDVFDDAFADGLAFDESMSGIGWGDAIGDDYGSGISMSDGGGGVGVVGGGVGGGGGLGTIGSGKDYGSSSNATVGAATVTGSMDGDIGRRIVRAHIDEVRACLPSTGSTTLDIALDVDDDGKVETSRASTTDNAVQRCVEKAMANWTFPRSLEGSLALTIRFDAPAP